MVDVRELKRNDRIIIKEEGEFFNQVGTVVFTDGNTAELLTLRMPENPYVIGIWNAQKMERYEN